LSGARAASIIAAMTTSESPVALMILRFGAAFCCIGHGAFGFITKAAWLPYFAVAGIPASVGWQLMPWIGAVDVLAGMAVLFAPRRLPLIYMATWGAWTALLRPLSGESVFEAVERAGNYGVPLACLLLAGMSGSIFARIESPLNDERTLARVRRVLQWTTCLLLAGHGALGIAGKALLTKHYAAIGLPATTTSLVGWLELALAAIVAVWPSAGLLLFIVAWKLASESLFVVSGAPVWELVERGGSYAAPLALAMLMTSASPKRPSASPSD
jgi:hypothetical protein